MKKILALILVVCLALGCFAACGEEEPKKTNKPKTSAIPVATTPAGDENTGDENTGDENTGDENTGDENTGDENTGDENTGDENTGDENKGDENTGDENTGDENTGDENTGDENTGDENTGDENTGDWEMPDNSELDCLAIDFRNGQVAYDEAGDGYIYLLAGETQGNNNVYLEAVDANGANPGYLSVSFEGEDPYMYIYDIGEFELQDYPFVKIVMKNNTATDGFELFLFEQGQACAGNVTITGNSASDTAFKTYYIDLRAKGASNTLNVDAHGMSLDRMFSAVRFDGPDLEGSIDIQYIGFFTSLEDAKAYK